VVYVLPTLASRSGSTDMTILWRQWSLLPWLSLQHRDDAVNIIIASNRLASAITIMDVYKLVISLIRCVRRLYTL